MAKITDYPSITTIDANTILLADGSSGTGKILASDMAKYALETYAGSTLAGSAQSVKAALTGLAPQVKASIADLSTISPGEQGYFQLNASVSPTGATAYFTVWCTGNAERRGLIAVYTAETETKVFANAGHATNGVFAWRGWHELAKFDDVYSISYDGMIKVASAGITDLNDITSPGSYIVTSSGISATLLNSPVTDSGFSIHVESVAGGTGQYIVQTVKRVRGSVNVAQTFTRIYTGAAWGAWVEDPSRAEVNALSSKLTINGIYRLSDAASLKPLSLTVPNGSRHLLILTGPYVSQAHAVYTVSCNTAGNVYAFRIGGTDDLPDKTSGTANSLTLTSTAESNRLPTVVDVVLSGDKITIAS